MLKRAEGGLEQVFMAMRFSSDPVLGQFLKKYDSVPQGDREHLSMEAIGLAAGLDIRQLYGATMIALQDQAVSTVKIIAMTSHPKITEARVQYGLLPLGERDRTALDTAMGFLPSPKGPTFIGKAVFGTGKTAMGEQRSDDDNDDGDSGEGPDLDRLFPPANVMQEKLQSIRQRMLPEGEPPK
jgi:hypothetical protein